MQSAGPDRCRRVLSPMRMCRRITYLMMQQSGGKGVGWGVGGETGPVCCGELL